MDSGYSWSYNHGLLGPHWLWALRNIVKNEFREQISFGCLVGGREFYLTWSGEKPGVYDKCMKVRTEACSRDWKAKWVCYQNPKLWSKPRDLEYPRGRGQGLYQWAQGHGLNWEKVEQRDFETCKCLFWLFFKQEFVSTIGWSVCVCVYWLPTPNISASHVALVFFKSRVGTRISFLVWERRAVLGKTVHLGFLKKQQKKGVFSRRGDWRGLFSLRMLY